MLYLRKIIVMIVACLTINAYSQNMDTVTIGTATQTTYLVPFSTNQYYSFTQQLYTASEISTQLNLLNDVQQGVIKSIAFQYINSTEQTRQNVTILIGHTSLSSLNASTGFISPAFLEVVFEDSIHFKAEAENDYWVQIPLQQPFQWDGVSNLVVCVVDNSAFGSTSTQAAFRKTNLVNRVVYANIPTTFIEDGLAINAVPDFNATATSFRPNIRFIFEDGEFCKKPYNIKVQNTTAHSIMFSWNNLSNNATSWNVAYKPSTSNSFSQTFTSNDSTYTINNLEAGTAYDIKVSADCDQFNTSLAEYGQFYTDCNTITDLPYSEDFSDDNNYKNCWRTTSYTGDMPVVTAGSLRFNSNSVYNSNFIQYTSLPPMNNISSLLMSFSTTRNIDVGVMSNVNDTNTFVLVKSLMVSSPGTATMFEVDFSSYNLTGKYITFRYKQSQMAMVDDINIDVAPLCSNVYNLQEDIYKTPNSVGIKWHNLQQDSIFEVAYAVYDSLSTFDPDNAATNMIEAKDNAMVEGLASGTTYNIAMRSVCQNGYGSWSNSIVVTTLSEPATIPYACDFENPNERIAWYLSGYYSSNNAYNKLCIGNAVNVPADTTNVDSQAIEGYSLYVSKDNISDSSAVGWTTQTSIAIRNFVSSGDAQYRLEFDVRGISMTGAYLKVSIDDSMTYKAGNVTQTATGYLTFDNFESNPNNLSKNYVNDINKSYHCIMTIPYMGETGNEFFLRFYWSNSYTAATTKGIAIDNITITPITCAPPVDVKESVNYNYATVSWKHLPMETSYIIQYSTDSTFQQDVNSQTVTANTSDSITSVRLNDLTPLTTYYYKLQSICSGNSSVVEGSRSFKTYDVISSIPWYEDFDTLTSVDNLNWPEGPDIGTIRNSIYENEKMFCWVYTSNAYQGKTRLGSKIILPLIDTSIDISQLVLRFTLMNNSNRNIIIAAMSNPLDTLTLVHLDTIGSNNVQAFNISNYSQVMTSNVVPPNAGTGNIVEVYLSNWTKDMGNALCIHTGGSGGVYLEDIGLYYASDCPTVYHLYDVNQTEHSITLAWDTINYQGNKWQIAYGDTNNFDPDNATIIDVTTWGTTIENLQSHHIYAFAIRQYCQENNTYSDWSAIRYAQTSAPAAQLPYYCDFEDATENNNWTIINGDDRYNIQYKNYVIDDVFNNTINGENCLRIERTRPDQTFLGTDVLNNYGASNVPFKSRVYAYRDIYIPDTVSELKLEFDFIATNTIPNYNMPYNNIHYDFYEGIRIYLMDTMSYITAGRSLSLSYYDSIQDTTINSWSRENQSIANYTDGFITQGLYRTSEWQHKELPINLKQYPDLQGKIWRFIIRYGINPNTKDTFAIDNIRITPMTCHMPLTKPEIISITSEENIVTYENSMSDNVELRFESSVDTIITISTQSPDTIGGLSLNTKYNLTIRNICSDSNYSMAPPAVSFTSSCYNKGIDAFPFIESFENGVSCWWQEPHTTENNGSRYNNLNIFNDAWTAKNYYYSCDYDWCDVYADSGNYFAASRYGRKLISPVLNIENMNYPVLHMKYYVGGEQGYGTTGISDTMTVWYRTSLQDTWHLISRFYLHGYDYPWLETTLALPNKSDQYQFAFGVTPGEYQDNYGAMIDWLEVKESDNLTVTTLSHSNKTQTSATIHGCATPSENDSIILQGFIINKLLTSTWDTIYCDNFVEMQANLQNLDSYTLYLYKAFVITETDTIYGSQEEFRTPAHVNPKVVTEEVTNLETNSATLLSTITAGSRIITSMGFEYKKITDSVYTTINVDSAANVTYLLTGLSDSTDYICRAFVVADGTTYYGSEVNFRTLDPAIIPSFVLLDSINNISQNSISLHATAYNGTGTITSIGLEYHKTSQTQYTTIILGNDTNIFYQINNLEANTQYAVRVFVESEFGKSYSEEITFVTTPHILPTITTNAVSNLTISSATLNATIVQGTQNITQKGFQYKMASSSSYVTVYVNEQTDNISYNAVGLTPNKEYTYRAFVKTSTDEIYSQEMNFTTLGVNIEVTADSVAEVSVTKAKLYGTILSSNAPIIKQGFLLRYADDTDYDTLEVSSYNMVQALNDLTDGSNYAFKAFVQTSDSIVTSNEIFFTTYNYIDVSTQQATAISQNKATLNGEIYENNDNITIQKGFEYKKANTTDSYLRIYIDGEDITYNLTGLTSNTQYQYRTFVVLANETFYGNVQHFTTWPDCQNTTEDITVNICAGESYTINNYDYTQAGTYTITLQSMYGCDSIINLTLNVNGSVNITNINASVCQGNTYDFNGKTLSQTGIYYDTMQNINGCDSIIALNFVINSVSNQTIVEQICEGDTYEFNGEILSQTGTYTATLLTESGCDSIVTLVLVITPTIKTSIDTTINDGSVYDFNGKTITQSGIYYDTVSAVNGCDSIITLHIIITNGLDDIATENSIVLHPNPATNIVYIDGINNTEVIITDNLGQIVIKQFVTDGKIDINKLEKGVYMVKIGNITKKLIVQ